MNKQQQPQVINQQQQNNQPYDSSVSHFRKEGSENGKKHIVVQSNKDHLQNVADIATALSEIAELNRMAWCIGRAHDLGKYTPAFGQYMADAIADKPVQRGSVDHSTAGGYFLDQICEDANFSQFLQYAVYAHHGLIDVFDNSRGEDVFRYRLGNEEKRVGVERSFKTFFSLEQTTDKVKEAENDYQLLKNKIKRFIMGSKVKNMYGNPAFYFGMYERVLLSLLIDADRMDTYHFMSGIDFKSKEIAQKREARTNIWKQCRDQLEYHISQLKDSNSLYDLRKEISNQCRVAGQKSGKLFRLSVPTGGGKTLSGLRFAIEKAIADQKSKIIYVAPYCTLLDQNAETIRSAVGNKEYVLEHHSNVMFEEAEEDKKERYEVLAANWDVPIVATTAVQFLNTLFDGGTKSIRRMHSLCNSVIILDEVQAIPMRITVLFNMAINFLTQFAGSSVVLCSATQPPFDELSGKKLLVPEEIISADMIHHPMFFRTHIQDKTDLHPGGMSLEQFANFIKETALQEKQVLVVVNTKMCARNVFMAVKQCQKLVEQGYRFFHISTNMCLKHRLEKLEELRESLEAEVKVICVSTTVIEAGVDISFQCGIRSLSGLDHIIQTAGRVNRNAAIPVGKLYIVELSSELENTSRLDGVDDEKLVMRDLLYEYRKRPENYDQRLDSDPAIKLFYKMYYERCKEKMNYIINADGVSDSLVQLFSGNSKLEQQKKQQNPDYSKKFLTHSFKTAGRLFEVIPEDGRVDIVIAYDEQAQQAIDLLSDVRSSYKDKKEKLQVLQSYTVSISNNLKNELGSLIYRICEETILVLNKDRYSEDYGVSEEATCMSNLIS